MIERIEIHRIEIFNGFDELVKEKTVKGDYDECCDRAKKLKADHGGDYYKVTRIWHYFTDSNVGLFP